MKEKLDQLENLLIEIEKTIENETDNQKLIQEITIEDWGKTIEDLELPDFTEEKRKIVMDNFIRKKTDKSLEEVEIPRLKSILEKTQSRILDFLDQGKEVNDQIIIRNLVKCNLISEKTRIYFGNSQNKSVTGNLTEQGYFNININGEIHRFTSFTEAAKKVNERAKDGWSVWLADDKFNQPQNLGYFKKELSSLMSKRRDFL